MQVSNKNQNIHFQAIALTPKEFEKAQQIVNRMTSTVVSSENDTVELYNIFAPHIVQEAQKASYSHIVEDVISELNLRFFEILEKVKNRIILQDIIDGINDFKPSKDTLKPEFTSISFDAPKFGNNIETSKGTNLTRLPIPESITSIENKRTQLKQIIENADLPPIIQERLKSRASGKKFREISEDTGSAIPTIYNTIRNAVFKIQYQNNCIPEEVTNQIRCMAQTLECSENDIIQVLLKQTHIITLNPEVILSNLKRNAQLLGCDFEKYKKIALNQPILLVQKPETTLKNICQSSQVLGCSQETFIKAGLICPNLFYTKSETLQKRIDKCIQLLDFEREEFIELAIKNPIFLTYKPETLLQLREIQNYYREIQNIKTTHRIHVASKKRMYSNILAALMKNQYQEHVPPHIREFNLEEFLKANADKNFEISVLKGKAARGFIEYIEKASRTITGKNIFKFIIVNNRFPTAQEKRIAIKESEKLEKIVNSIIEMPVFNGKDKITLKENILNLMNELGCTPQEFNRAVKKYPKILLYDRKTMLANLRQSAELLEIDFEQYKKAALLRPRLFCINSKLILKNFKQIVKKLKRPSDTLKQAALEEPQIFYRNPKLILTNIIQYAHEQNITREQALSEAFKNPKIFITKIETDGNDIVEEIEPKPSYKLSYKEIEKLSQAIQASINENKIPHKNAQMLIENSANTIDELVWSIEGFLHATKTYPQLYYLKAETIIDNLEQGAKIFGCSIEEYKKLAFKEPSLLYKTPETLFKNIQSMAEKLNVNFEEFKIAAFKQPAILYQSPETILSNVQRSSQAVGWHQKDFIDYALRNPILFISKPETIKRKSQIQSYYKKIQGQESKTLVLASYKRLYSNILYYLLKKTQPEILTGNIAQFDLQGFLKSNKKASFTLEIPQDEVAQDFVQFIDQTSQKTIGKNIFEFKIIENAA